MIFFIDGRISKNNEGKTDMCVRLIIQLLWEVWRWTPVKHVS